MKRSSPWILWRFLTNELWRLLLISGTILVTVIAFAAAIKWFAEGRLGPADTLKFMALAIPPMLAYTLPFSAAFAATLTYHRMTQDNEVIASHAGGISHRSILIPAFASGVVLAGGLAALNEQIIPRFLSHMERLITNDLSKILVGMVQRGEALHVGDHMVYADDGQRLHPADDPDLAASGVQQWIVLWGVVAMELDSEENVVSEVTAERAQVIVRPIIDERGEASSLAVVQLENAIGRLAGRALSGHKTVTWNLSVPDQFKDDPKFCTTGELLRLKNEPERMNFIRVRCTDLAHHLAERETTQTLENEFRTHRRARLTNDRGEPVYVLASGIHWDNEEGAWILEPVDEGGPVEVQEIRDLDVETARVTRLTARRATLRTDMGEGPRARDLTIRISLEDVETRGVGGEDDDAFGERTDIEKTGLKLSSNPLEPLLGMGAIELLDVAEPRAFGAPPDQFLVPPTYELREEVEKLRREVWSKQNERAAMAASCLVMVLCGAVTALRMRDAVPLHVYLWSFFPALACVITISSGQQMMHEMGWAGVPVLWGGVGGLALYTFLAYLGLRRH